MEQPNFGGELRGLRQQRGLSLKEFAQLVHYDPGYISKIENGRKAPTAMFAARCDAALRTGSSLSALVPAPLDRKPPKVAHEVRMPVVIDGRPVLLPIKSSGQLNLTADGDENRGAEADLAQTLSRNLPGSSAAMVLNSEGMAWQWELPGGHAFGGATLPVHRGEASWSTYHAVVIADQRLRPLREFISSVPRGIVIVSIPGESISTHALLDVVAARKQAPGRTVMIPKSFEADDLTLEILWALANLDEALLNDDGTLAQARQRVRDPAELKYSAIPSNELAELSTISQMWLGSESCARFIISSTRNFSHRPVFWTREQRGEEASTWLFFQHKLEYLQTTSRIFAGTSEPTSRTFCVPESAVLDSHFSERVLLLLAAALMESLGIRTQFCPDPALSQMDGFALATGSEAVIANWVRMEGRWHVDRTRSTSVIQAFGDVIGHAGAHGLSDAANPAARLAALADYLGISWSWVMNRCSALAAYTCRDFARPRSRLLSTDGVDAACRYVASLRHEPTSGG
ncbi:MAG: helix-turn-helix domain-containing protein [Pseudonocardiales bacterium]|nr:helix-turn-helix domain-containing protein [Pseudonocardiales bacterium]